MENINITTQGVKGGQTKTQNVGYLMACLRHESDRIIIDDYEGTGGKYKQRELQNIEIIQNGKVLFSGDKYQLFELLKPAKNVENILSENERVQNFIKDYQSKNDYNPKFLDEYNAKFNSEFNDFLENSNFSKETIELFKSQCNENK